MLQDSGDLCICDYELRERPADSRMIFMLHKVSEVYAGIAGVSIRQQAFVIYTWQTGKETDMREASIMHTVAFCDLDGMRAVYHTNYIKWFDLARTELYRQAGFHQEKWEEGGVLLPLVVCNCEYLEGAVFGDELKVTARAAEVKRKVITLEYEIENTATGRIICKGLTKQVCCDENNKSFVLEERYPELVKNLLE